MSKTDKATEANQWNDVETKGSEAIEQSEWVKPAEGVVLEGVLTTAFVTMNDGKPQAAYSIQDEKGHLWAFGEKASFKSAIRAMRMGTLIRIEFVSLEDIGSNRQAWRVKMQMGKAGAGKPAIDLLRQAWRALKSDLPF